MDYSEQKLVARINQPEQPKEYQWLVIDYDADYTKGFYLFVCGKTPDDILVDHWFQTEAEARAYASARLGVTDKAWEATKRSLDQIKTALS